MLADLRITEVAHDIQRQVCAQYGSHKFLCMIRGMVRTCLLSDSRIMLYTYRNQECGEADGQDLSRESEG